MSARSLTAALKSACINHERLDSEPLVDITVQIRTSTLTSLSWRARTQNVRCPSIAKMAMR